MKLLIADNHGVLRAGLRLLVQDCPDISVVGEVGSGIDAVAEAELRQPDIVLMDYSMPGIDGAEATRRIRKVAPRTRVVILSRFGDHAYVRRAGEAGAAGYVLKSSDPERLITALRVVAAGHKYTDPAIRQRHVEGARSLEDETPGRALGLSQREAEVLHAAANGESSKEIARKLDLSTRTVEFHRYRAMKKLGIRGRAALVRFAIAEKWLPVA